MAEGAEQQVTSEGVPPFVITPEDRERWSAAGEHARAMLGDDANAESVWYMQRELFHNKDYNFA